MLRTIAVYVLSLIPLVGISSCGSASMSSSSPQSPNISIAPTSAEVGSVDVALTVTGSAFTNDPHNKSIVVFSAGSDTALSTTFISSSQLSAVVPANLMVNPVTADIFVETGDPMGSFPLAKSDKVTFSVVVGAPAALTISSVSPAGALAGSSDLTITVTGTGFITGGPHHTTWVLFDTHYLGATVVSDTQLTAVIPAALMVSAVSGVIEVQTGDPASSLPPLSSNKLPFNITSQ
jgi:hypothetical protein